MTIIPYQKHVLSIVWSIIIVVTKGSHGELLGKDLMQITNVETDMNCVNCASIQKQLHIALMELKSAEAIISLLREDVKCISSETSMELQYTNAQPVNSERETKTVIKQVIKRVKNGRQ